jgi:hypothetical protein
MTDLIRTVRREDPGELILRTLAGTRLAVREQRLDVRGAARWLAGYGWERDEILSAVMAMSALQLMVIRGDGWQLLSGIFAHGDMNEFVLATLAEVE